MSVVLLRYTLHNLCLDSLNIYQRKLSLYAACGHAEEIKVISFSQSIDLSFYLSVFAYLIIHPLLLLLLLLLIRLRL